MKAVQATDKFTLTRSMKVALIVSILFHLTIVAAGTIGLPFISKPPRIPNAPISVDVIDVSEAPTTNKKPSKNKPKPDKPKEPPKTQKKVAAPPKVEAKAPPKVVPVKKPEIKKDTVKPTPKVPPPPAEKLEKVKEPEKKPEKKEEATTQEDEFASLMKNLQDSEEASDAEGIKEDTSEDKAPDAPFAQTMTNHELGALASQLEGCWQIPIGAENVHNTVVDIRIWVGADRIVRRAEIVDKLRMATDPAFRALAESAKRATLDPACNPVNIPTEKYEVWKDKYIQIPFDPRSVT